MKRNLIITAVAVWSLTAAGNAQQISAKFDLTVLPPAPPASPAQRPMETNKLERKIRTIDRAEATAVLAADIPAIEKFWADDFTVNAPNNQILKGKDGILDYLSFERAVEAVLVHWDTVIIMGEETVKSQGKVPFADQTVRRRFTNIWMKRDAQ